MCDIGNPEYKVLSSILDLLSLVVGCPLSHWIHGCGTQERCLGWRYRFGSHQLLDDLKGRCVVCEEKAKEES